MSPKIPLTDFVVPLSQAVWLNPPTKINVRGNETIITTDMESDFWRITSHNFIHDSGHALLTELENGRAIEVTFKALLEGKFDQVGLMVRIDSHNWIKVSVELVNGAPHLAVVVTREHSDWSTVPVPSTWNDGLTTVTVRASRSGDALTVRARVGSEPWQFVRLAPLDPSVRVTAGPMACSPTRAGLEAHFVNFALGPADLALHD